MSASYIMRRDPPYRPFQCPICDARFSRGENLKRHAALHSRSQNEAPLPCEFCHVTFSRADLRNRHMKRKHPDQEQRQAERESRRRRTTTSQTSDRGAAQDNNIVPVSPSDSHGGMFPSTLGDEYGRETDNRIWEPSLSQGQLQLGPVAAQHSGNANSAATAPMNTGGNGGSPSGNHVLSIDRILQSATDLERDLLLETALFDESGLRLEATTQSASYGTNFSGFNPAQVIPETLLVTGLTPPQDERSLSCLQITRGCDLFFRHVAPFLPFLHRLIFDAAKAPPHLVISMLSLGYQYGEDPDYGDQEGSGVSLSVRCFHQARTLIASDEESTDVFSHNLTIIQSYLLLEICALMYLCGDYSAYGLKMHSNMISLARAGGLMQPMSIGLTVAKDLESLWRQFIKAESHKRTLFAVHQIDALWYQFLSIPRSISHLEIKHDLPCPENHWNASSSAEWAHRRLVEGNTGPSVQYADAVRLFLSPDEDLSSIPPFDPYGAVNIAQFLISSAREVSGWSTMTGMLSIERFGALKSSLVTLGPYIRPHEKSKSPRGAACAASTWETAMIELQMWSPSHTGGIVEGSMDAMLSQSTCQAPSFDFLYDVETAKGIQPHIDWFLRYLDETLTPDSEAPWVLIYSYKAFLIAWQLVRRGVPAAMQTVGIDDGDVEGAVVWARKVFQRRLRHQLGRLICSCLDDLGHHAAN